MKAILEFNLPEEQSEFKDAQNGSYWRGAIQEFDNYLRNQLKYGELSEAVSKSLELARNELYTACDKHSIWGD